MAGTERPTTPPRAPAPNTAITPEQVRRMEEARLRAKALRSQHQQNQSSRPSTRSQNVQTPPQIAGQKRPAPTAVPSTVRDASSNNGLSSSNNDTSIRPARKFQKFVDYDFSKMTD